MKIKSALMSSASGSLGGFTSQRSRGGQILKSRNLPTNMRSASQSSHRSAFSAVSAIWSTLTDAQRDSWSVYAANTLMPDALGDMHDVGGRAHFIRSNFPRFVLVGNLGLVLNAPQAHGLAERPMVTPVHAWFHPATNYIFIQAQFHVLHYDSGIPHRSYIFTSFSRPISSSIKSFRGNYFFSYSSTAPTSGYDGVFDCDMPNCTADQIGNVIWVKVLYSLRDGRLSTPVIYSQVVTMEE